MKLYKILSLSVTGKSKKIFSKGSIVSENDFIPGMANKLLQLRFIELFEEPQTPFKIAPVEIVKGKIKMAIVSAIWKRHNVFEMFAKGIHLLEAKSDIEIVTIIAGSEGNISKKIVEKHGFIYVEMPNSPLANKVNKPLEIAKQLNVDYVMCMGSDDIISIELLFEYEKIMRKGIDFIGVTDFYFYDLKSKKAIYWAGYLEPYRKGHTCGAARVLSKRLLNAWNWRIWETVDDKVLDSSMQKKLKRTNYTEETFSLKEKCLYALDIKSETNMTPFALWNNSEYISESEIKNKFPFVCVE